MVYSPPRSIARRYAGRALIPPSPAALDPREPLGQLRRDRIARACDRGLDRVAHLDVGGGEVVAGEPGMLAEVLGEEREVGREVRIEVPARYLRADRLGDRANQERRV